MIIVLSILYFLFVLYLLFFIKLDNAIDNHFEILRAIEKFSDDTQEYDTALFMIRAMESHQKTAFRFWDWGCKNILPKQYFELIKPYIK